MKCRSSWELCLAGPEDSPGIQKVFDDGSFQGPVAVKFGRAPDPYRSLANDGEHVIVPIVKDTSSGEILGCGGLVIRREHVNGAQRNCGYLTGLKILQSHQRRVVCIKEAYQLLQEQAAAFEPYYYTTILKSNEPAIKLLEKRRKGMPAYIYLGEYTVFCLGTGLGLSGGSSGSSGGRLVRGHSPELAAFYAEQLPRYNLSPASERLYGLKDSDYYSMIAPSGKILAACAIWNQQSYKQYHIAGYGGIYKTLSHLPIGLLGYPAMPKAGTDANYASIAMLAVADEGREAAAKFLRLVLGEASQYDFVMLGLFENHPLLKTLQKLRHIKYCSRLYAVDYTGEQDASGGLDSRPIMLEVGLL